MNKISKVISFLKMHEIMGVPKFSILAWSIIIFSVNLLLRLPGIFQDLPPHTFIDEYIYTEWAFKMYKGEFWQPNAFLAGGMNYYLPTISMRFFSYVTGFQFDYVSFTIFSRLITVGFLSSVAPVFVFAATLLIARGQIIAALFASISMTISPMALGLSRVHYPDEYIVFFSALLLLLSLIIFQNTNGKLLKLLLLPLVMAMTVSVKYSAGYLFLVPLYYYLLSQTKTRVVSVVIEMAAIALLMLIFFYFINPYMDLELLEDALRFHKNHYVNGHAGLETDGSFGAGILFYSKILYLTAFGILGFVVYAFGVVRMIKIVRPEHCLLILLLPVVFILMIGSYKIVINRNLMGILPYFFIVLGFGFSLMYEFLIKSSNDGSSKYKLFFITIFFLFTLIEPVARISSSLRKDFLQDSRVVADNWIKSNIDDTKTIGYSLMSQCCGPEHPSDKIWNLGMPVSTKSQSDKCVDYYVMDSWFYETAAGLGRSVFELPIYHEHHYMNTAYGNYNSNIVKGDIQRKFLSKFELIKEFSGEYYGPNVYIYKVKNKCN